MNNTLNCRWIPNLKKNIISQISKMATKLIRAGKIYVKLFFLMMKKLIIKIKKIIKSIQTKQIKKTFTF